MITGARPNHALAAAVLVACAALAAAPAAAQSPEPQKGGTIVVGEWQAATQLNGFLTNAKRNTEPVHIVSRSLATVNTDGEIIPELLTEWPTTDNGGLVLDEDGDGFTLNLKLKPGLAWSDGAPLTLHDYKWDYDWAVTTGQAGVGCPYCPQLAPLVDSTLTGAELWAPENQYVDSFEVAEDGLSASLHLRKNFGSWITMLTEIPLIAPQYWKDVPADEIAKRAVPGSASLLEIPWSGPFVVAAASEEGIDFAPNPNWHADTGPYLDQIRLRWFGSKPGELTAFLDGTIDLTLNTNLADVATIESVDPSIGRAIVDAAWQYEHLDFNTERTNQGFDDPAVRRALAMAIDKQHIVDVLFPGQGLTPACSYAPDSTWYHTDLQCDPFDPEKAAAALDAAGWVVDTEKGTRVKGDLVMRPRMCTSSGNPLRLTTLGLIAQDWANIGVAADIQTENTFFGDYGEVTAETQCNIYRGTFDNALYTDSLSPDPASDAFNKFYSTQAATDAFPGGVAIARLHNPEMDAAIDTLKASITAADVAAASAKVQELVRDLAPEVPLYYRPEPTGVGKHLGGFEHKNPSTATDLWDVENWYFIQ